jgi:hypothetical protein
MSAAEVALGFRSQTARCGETDFRDAQALDFIGAIFRLISYPLLDGRTAPMALSKRF